MRLWHDHAVGNLEVLVENVLLGFDLDLELIAETVLEPDEPVAHGLRLELAVEALRAFGVEAARDRAQPAFAGTVRILRAEVGFPNAGPVQEAQAGVERLA